MPDAKVIDTDDEMPPLTGVGRETELETQFKVVACPTGTELPSVAEEVGPSDFETFPIAVATLF